MLIYAQMWKTYKNEGISLYQKTVMCVAIANPLNLLTYSHKQKKCIKGYGYIPLNLKTVRKFSVSRRARQSSTPRHDAVKLFF